MIKYCTTHREHNPQPAKRLKVDLIAAHYRAIFSSSQDSNNYKVIMMCNKVLLQMCVYFIRLGAVGLILTEYKLPRYQTWSCGEFQLTQISKLELLGYLPMQISKFKLWGYLLIQNQTWSNEEYIYLPIYYTWELWGTYLFTQISDL